MIDKLHVEERPHSEWTGAMTRMTGMTNDRNAGMTESLIWNQSHDRHHELAQYLI